MNLSELIGQNGLQVGVNVAITNGTFIKLIALVVIAVALFYIIKQLT